MKNYHSHQRGPLLSLLRDYHSSRQDLPHHPGRVYHNEHLSEEERIAISEGRDMFQQRQHQRVSRVQQQSRSLGFRSGQTHGAEELPLFPMPVVANRRGGRSLDYRASDASWGSHSTASDRLTLWRQHQVSMEAMQRGLGNGYPRGGRSSSMPHIRMAKVR